MNGSLVFTQRGGREKKKVERGVRAVCTCFLSECMSLVSEDSHQNHEAGGKQVTRREEMDCTELKQT